MKRVWRLITAVVLLMAMAVSVAAVTPRWSELERIHAEFSISSSGTAEFKAIAQASLVDRLDMTVTLEMDDGGGWEKVKSWNRDVDNWRVEKSGSCSVEVGPEYRLVVSVDVYVDGRYVETGEETFYEE